MFRARNGCGVSVNGVDFCAVVAERELDGVAADATEGVDDREAGFEGLCKARGNFTAAGGLGRGMRMEEGGAHAPMASGVTSNHELSVIQTPES